MTLSNEVQLQFRIPESPEQAQPAWRAQPPPAFDSYALIDESYNSLTFEQRRTDGAGAIMNVMTLGLGKKFLPTATVEKLSVRFDLAPGGIGSQVTVVGHGDEQTRQALGEMVEGYGGSTGLTYGTSG